MVCLKHPTLVNTGTAGHTEYTYTVQVSKRPFIFVFAGHTSCSNHTTNAPQHTTQQYPFCASCPPPLPLAALSALLVLWSSSLSGGMRHTIQGANEAPRKQCLAP